MQRIGVPLGRIALLSETGVGVTICIAAKNSSLEYIVAVSDMMISYNDAIPAAESAFLKTFFVSPNWAVLFAGDATRAWEIIQKLCQLLSADGDQSATHVLDIVCKNYREAVENEVTSTFLVQPGFNSIAEFRREGRVQLGSMIFSRI